MIIAINMYQYTGLKIIAINRFSKTAGPVLFCWNKITNMASAGIREIIKLITDRTSLLFSCVDKSIYFL